VKINSIPAEPRTYCYNLAAAGNKRAMWPPLPPLGRRGDKKETGRNWWVRRRAV